ncbi:hypothetical protein IKE83_01785 [Candidatus Saccharibacteria bacterium]|nr:hypothetical protein [Candidatus Saccharibacteria bacterium]
MEDGGGFREEKEEVTDDKRCEKNVDDISGAMCDGFFSTDFDVNLGANAGTKL